MKMSGFAPLSTNTCSLTLTRKTVLFIEGARCIKKSRLGHWPLKSRSSTSFLGTVACLVALMVGNSFPRASSFTPVVDQNYCHITHTSIQNLSRKFGMELRVTNMDKNIDVKSMLYQDQEVGITNRAIHEASIMKSMQEELLVATDIERSAASKRVIILSKIRSSSVGFGKATTSNTSKSSKGKTNSNVVSPTIAAAAVRTRVFKDKEGYNSILQENGVVRINNVLPLETAQSLYSYICQEKIDAERAISDGLVDIRSRFANALLKKNRYDLLLPLEESASVMKGLYDTLVVNKILSSIISSRFGVDAELYELGALISDPGSDRQVIHPDVPFQEDMPSLTCFIALQDIDTNMGGTVFIPKTITPEHHALLKDHTMRDGMLQSVSSKLSILSVGDCTLFDSRLLHAGGANTSDKRRILFYFTFRDPALADPGSVNNPGSIRRELKARRLSLQQIQQIATKMGKRS